MFNRVRLPGSYHHRLAAFNAVLKASKDFSKDKQKPFEAGTSGKSGIMLGCLSLKDSGPIFEKIK